MVRLAPFVFLGGTMTEAQASILANLCNQFGVLLKYEIHGVQHEFTLNVRKLSPTAVVFERNKDHISNNSYCLIPIQIAANIKGVGKKLFDDKDYTYPNVKRKQVLTRNDYERTEFGKYLRIESLDKIEKRKAALESMMREVASRGLSNKYEEYYRSTFIIAFDYFSGGMKEFQKLTEKINGSLSLFWSEVKSLYDELNELEIEFRKLNSKDRFTLQHLARLKRKSNLPALQSALKMKHIPKTKDDYLRELTIKFFKTGFHPQSFTNRLWAPKYSEICNFESVNKYIFAFDKDINKIFNSMASVHKY